MSGPEKPGGTIETRYLQALKKRFDKGTENYETLCKSRESLVVRWVWAAGYRYHLDPLYFYEPAHPVGTVLQLPPKDPRGSVAYGFSKENRIVEERQYVVSLSGGRHYKFFYCDTEDRILSYQFHYDPAVSLLNCTQLIFSGLHPACYQRWAVGGWSSHTYMTAEGRIRHFTNVFKEDDEPRQRLSGDLRYDESGRVEVWTKWPGMRKPERTFRGFPPAENPFLRAESGLPRPLS